MASLHIFFLLILSTGFLDRSLATDRTALLAFKTAITSDPHNILTKNWSTETETASVCHWTGVSCGGAENGRVTALNLSGFGLGGSLPPHLGNLTFLEHFDLSSNDFAGVIPSSLGALPRLEALLLGNNSFSGSIPEEIANCSSLQVLFLNRNRLTGSIPNRIFNLSSARNIGLDYNELSGELPSDMCDNFPNLIRISLSVNRIEGRIPSNIRRCRELEIVSLSYNRFGGEIPREIGSLSKLRTLYLGLNDFEGGVPAELGNLSRLEVISIAGASLTGLIPKEIGNCTSLLGLELKDNYLTGELPRELGNPTSLEFFNVRNNSLSGSIPPSIFNVSTISQVGLAYNRFSGNLLGISEFPLSNLEELYLSGNELVGEIPTSIVNASKLTILSMANNSFTGSMPDFGNLRLLQRLWIWNNNLTGTEFLSSFSNCRYLETLAVSGNPLHGFLPDSIGNLSSSLKILFVENCNVTGAIPRSIGNLTGLSDFLLSNNELEGLIPTMIGDLRELQRLFLYGNRLSGHIPLEICQLSKLGELYMYGNNLTGPIPECLGGVESLRDVNLGSNKLDSDVPSGFWNLRDLVFLNLSSNYLTGNLSSRIGSLKEINGLDLSRNRFSGNIPSSIDGCESLENLSLSNNMLEGSIPPSLGKIRGLRTLDLSSNNLSGSIPESLSGLSLLEFFNVSHNKLEGEIPGGGPFGNFTADSFLDNSGLCGGAEFRLPRCVEKGDRKSRMSNVGRLMKFILPPFVSVVAISIVVAFVIFRRRKRVPSRTDDSVGGDWSRISYIELSRGTNAFGETNLLGKGSFGSVYKGSLYDGSDIAVKVFDLRSERVVRSFETECEILSNVRHRNLVRIIGCCSSPEFKALVLEYMPNGSLDKWLHSDKCCLDLMQRLRIALDVASALEYLHHDYTSRIVHCDVKPSNVLLDEDMVARLADFGISKLFDDGESMAHTKTLATFGYAAPEYGSEGKVSTSGDVYSFGILLLEMFTRKRPTDDMFGEKMSLQDWVQRSLQDNAASDVMDHDLLSKEADDDQHSCVSSVFHLAMNCLSISPDERINMIDAAVALKRITAKFESSAKTDVKYSAF